MEKLTPSQLRILEQAIAEGGIQRHCTLYRKPGGRGMWKSATIQPLLFADLLVGDGSADRVVITEAGRAVLGRRGS